MVQDQKPTIAVYSSRFPTMVVQHAVTDDKGKTKEYDFKFEHGVLRFYEGQEKLHELFIEAWENLHESLSSAITKMNNREEIEKIVAEHKAQQNRQTTAMRGPLTATAAIQQNPEALEAKVLGNATGQARPEQVKQSLFAALHNKEDTSKPEENADMEQKPETR
jgi:hypothetical protein